MTTFWKLIIFLILEIQFVYNIPIDREMYIEKVNNISHQNIVSLQTNTLSKHRPLTKLQRYKHFCNGYFLNRKWILTAAHCVWNKKPNQIVALIGNSNFYSVQDKFLKPIKRIEYFNYQPTRLQNDIALLEVYEINTVGPHLDSNYAGIFHSDFNLSQKYSCYVFSYNNTKRTEGKGTNHVVVSEVNLITNKRCQYYFSELWTPRNGDNKVCALNRLQNSCKGNSGSPLLCPDEKKNYYLYGILSYGMSCELIKAPNVYTLTNSYNQWINKTIQKH